MSDHPVILRNPLRPLPANIMYAGWGMIVAGIAWCLLGYWTNARQAAFDNIIGFLFLTSIASGALILLAIDYVSGAVWSVPVRRIMEFLAVLTPLAPALALPLFSHLQEIFPWANPAVLQSDSLVQSKHAYLNIEFLAIRFVVIFIIWIGISHFLSKNSAAQDATKDARYTRWNIRLSGIFIPVFAFSVTLFAVDWAMSLEPHWYSTIYGVYYFSGAALAGVAAATYITVKLHEHGFLPQLRRDHFYSLGTLMFVFVNFWAYIAFSQFLLIWYANLPEETYWFIARWKNGWEVVSILLIVVHFAVPYFMLLSQDSKMDLKRLKMMALWLLFSHMLDLYWLVMPSFSDTPVLSWMEISFPLLVVGLVIVIFAWNMKRQNLIPVGDPKLERGLDFRL